MGWANVDDGFITHPKITDLMLDHDDPLRAVGLWTVALAWAHRHTVDKPHGQQGVIPESQVRLWERSWGGAVLAAKALASVGLWDMLPDGSYQIHDFRYWGRLDQRDARVKGGRMTAHRRFGTPLPFAESSSATSSATSSGDSSATSSNEEAISLASNPHPTPHHPTPPHNTKDSSSEPATPDTDDGVDSPGARDDVERICGHLADRLEGNFGKRPNIIKGWRAAARRMMELDGLTEEQIHAAIDWCQDDEFWAPNIRSVSKLRDKYLTLRTQAKRRPPAGRDSTTNARVAQGLDLAAQYEQRERALSSGRQREITGGE